MLLRGGVGLLDGWLEDGKLELAMQMSWRESGCWREVGVALRWWRHGVLMVGLLGIHAV